MTSTFTDIKHYDKLAGNGNIPASPERHTVSASIPIPSTAAIDDELLGHRVVVSFGTCHVVVGKFMEVRDNEGVRWAIIGKTKSLIPFPVKESMITKFHHHKFECGCKA